MTWLSAGLGFVAAVEEGRGGEKHREVILVQLPGACWAVPKGEIMSHVLAGLLANVVNVPDPLFQHLAVLGVPCSGTGLGRGSGYSSRAV